MKQQIIEILKQHKGKGSAITVAEITDMAGMISLESTNLRTRQIIRQIIDDGDLPVGSCGNGYYVIINYEELEDNILNLIGRIAGINKRKDNLIKAYKIYP